MLATVTTLRRPALRRSEDANALFATDLPTGREARLADVDTRRLAAAGQAAESAGYADKNPRRAG